MPFVTQPPTPKMALTDLLKHYGDAEYRPHSLRLSSAAMLPLHALSAGALYLVDIMLSESGANQRYTNSDGRDFPAVAFTPDVSWKKDGAVRTTYDRLSETEKAEVLGFLTFPIHEMTHHVDHLTTPFGILYHASCCAEYVAMQRFAPEICSSAESFINEPLASLRDCPVLGGSSAWDNLRTWVRFFDACRGAPNWAVDSSASANVQLFGVTLSYCRIYNSFESVRSLAFPRYYLRPTSLLETRAVVHSLRYILFLFDKQEAARHAIQCYIDSYYPAGNSTLDYTFVLDLFARMYSGIGSFTQLIAKAPTEAIDSWLLLLDGICWYSLQAPPRLDFGSSRAVGPVERFIFGALHFARRLARERELKIKSVVSLLNGMDTDKTLQELGCTPIEPSLKHSLDHLADIRTTSMANVSNKNIRSHFQHVFKAQTYFMRQRQGHGYNSFTGLPENGNVVGSLLRDREVDYLGLHFAKYGYQPNRDVVDWFSDRESFLFRYRFGAENEALRNRLRARFPPLVGCESLLCKCGVTVTGRVPSSTWRYYCRCPTCGVRLRISRLANS